MSAGADQRPRDRRSRARRKAQLRRQRILVVTALGVVVLALMLVVALPGLREKPAPSPSPTPAPVVRTAAVTGVSVSRGDTATFAYRIEAPAGTEWQVTLAATTAAGGEVWTRELATPVAPGRHTVRLAVDLAAGRYRYLVHVAPAPAGGVQSPAPAASEESAASAALVVSPPRPPAYPSAAAIDRALEWAEERSGKLSVAIIDSDGELHGLRPDEQFQSASISKAMLLVAYLRHEPQPDAAMEATLTTMIEKSDNAAADTVFAEVGAAGLTRLAAAAGMKGFSAGSSWIDCQVTAADQARFFLKLSRYVPASRQEFARTLLSGIVPIQRWGIVAAAGPEGWEVYFKSGWLGLDNRLMTQAAWLEREGVTWSLAILSDDNPDRTYGWQTQKGITGMLLGAEPTPEYLAGVLEG